MDLSTDGLAAFAVFADHLNFTRAAAELHISQPALHVKVAKLAESLGRPLYRKQGRALLLTPDGEAVARFARELDTRVTTFLDELRGGTPTRPVTLAAGEGAYLYLLGDLIRDRVDRPPPLRLLNRDRAGMLAAVRSGRADLGVGVLDAVPDDLDTTPLATYPLTLVLPAEHRLAHRRRLRVADLGGLPLVLPPAGRPLRTTVEGALRASKVDWTVGIEAQGWPLLLHFVSLGAGFGVVNGCVRPPAGLVARELTDLPPVSYYAVRAPGREADTRVGQLLDDLRDHLRRHEQR
jgi:LysR family transcriptional regulator, low CO2-responsive transcriptional regulator